MNLRQIQDIAGHRDVPPWVIKLVQDCIEHDRMYERAQPQDNLNCKSVQARLATLWGYVKAQPQGEWVDLTIDEIAKALNTADSHNTIDSYRSVIAKFKEKNTPTVAPKGEPVAWPIDGETAERIANQQCVSYEVVQLIAREILCTTPPSVEAAIEATKENAADLVERFISGDGYAEPFISDIAAAIRSMK